ncbi:hypothetical protein NE237_032939 [Protea cynaroides]|uniref:Uncharacterized protein n=1 Tax=Protea cynaroides TaxID=273540 RepID=A0A9Q0L422_9MAGN|nr:hypothetical protein NE237_032939 [Protea cynaroides]
MSIVVPLPKYPYKEEEEEDLCISIESFPKESLRSPMQKEKQISVDPISLKHQSMRYAGPPLLLPPIDTSIKEVPLYPPPLPLSRDNFLSASLPGSTSTSPRSSGLQSHTKNVKKGRNQAQPSLGLSRFASEQKFLRSKSCGEGRVSAPSQELEFYSRKLCRSGKDKPNESPVTANAGLEAISRFEPTGIRSQRSQWNKLSDGSRPASLKKNPNRKEVDIFKCGACLFLPAFGRGKPVRSASKAEGEAPVAVVERNVISRTVSLEKFECGSWSSSGIMNEDDEDHESMHNLYFDLPLELIKNSGNDANSPVTTAFIFDSDRSGALKQSSSRTTPRKPQDQSSCHVRISMIDSPGSCITPRLRKERDDFNAFLQAQNA